jgi:aminoglycoside phosphotransferase (APT) family kinase protein
MDLIDLHKRLIPFCRAMCGDESVEVSDVVKMPGHAGFSFGFTLTRGGQSEKFVLRLPPPGVQWRGTADVLRQVAVLNALDGTDVPHVFVTWSGDDERWFGSPYFVVPMLEGDVLRLENRDALAALPADTRRSMGEQAMTALANLHQVDWRRAEYLGEPIPFEDDVTRWDRFVEKAAEPQDLALAPSVRETLLERLPQDAPVGIFHGDYQWSNLFFSPEKKLIAVIDWELTGVGATLNDVGWIATFSDSEAWDGPHGGVGIMPPAGEMVAMYTEAWGGALPDIAWYRALAAYKFAIITGFNLMLHRRGKRHDPIWEETRKSMVPLLERARDLLAE